MSPKGRNIDGQVIPPPTIDVHGCYVFPMTSRHHSSDPPPTPPPRSHIVTIGALQFASYFIITLNMRAVAELDYLMTAVTDVFLAAIAFTSIKRVAQATTSHERMSYIIGSLFGAQCALLYSSWMVSK